MGQQQTRTKYKKLIQRAIAFQIKQSIKFENSMQLKKIADGEQYDKAATSMSLATISYFFATFGYLFFFSTIRPSLVTGVAFILIGMFAVSLLIAFPLFYIKFQIPKLSIVIVLLNIILTIFITKTTYLWLFEKPQQTQNAFVVNCKKPIPEFTLDYDSKPNEAQLETLCECIENRVSYTELKMFKTLQDGKTSEITREKQNKLISDFGVILHQCGANKM